jgi:hypothetical protein
MVGMVQKEFRDIHELTGPRVRGNGNTLAEGELGVRFDAGHIAVSGFRVAVQTC